MGSVISEIHGCEVSFQRSMDGKCHFRDPWMGSAISEIHGWEVSFQRSMDGKCHFRDQGK